MFPLILEEVGEVSIDLSSRAPMQTSKFSHYMIRVSFSTESKLTPPFTLKFTFPTLECLKVGVSEMLSIPHPPCWP